MSSHQSHRCLHSFKAMTGSHHADPGFPLRSSANWPRPPFHHTLGVVLPSLSNLALLVCSRYQNPVVFRHRLSPDSSVHKRPGGISASPRPSSPSVTTRIGNSGGARGHSIPAFPPEPLIEPRRIRRPVIVITHSFDTLRCASTRSMRHRRPQH